MGEWKERKWEWRRTESRQGEWWSERERESQRGEASMSIEWCPNWFIYFGFHEFLKCSEFDACSSGNRFCLRANIIVIIAVIILLATRNKNCDKQSTNLRAQHIVQIYIHTHTYFYMNECATYRITQINFHSSYSIDEQHTCKCCKCA